MPYKSLTEINPSLRGIKPPITLEQANTIAAQAEGVGTDEKKNGWAIAIANFKKANTVRKGKWVKRDEMAKKEDMPKETPPKATEMDYGSMGIEPTYGATSFDQLDQMRQADETTEKLGELIGDLTSMMTNICYSAIETDKGASLQRLLDDFMVRAQEVIANPTTETEETAVEMAESYAVEASEIVSLEETQPDKSVLAMDVKIIKPGWGNTRDNNFYPADMLKRDAGKFVGAKMYETDHKDAEKSTRTWVSTITGINGFTSDGAPIARVAVHDPNFAERIKNLKGAGILEKMECSIYGSAKGKAGYEQGGRSGKLIEAISDISSVDWVTKAGAGGHVVGLSESAASEEKIMETETKTIEASRVIVTDKPAEEPVFLSEAEVRQELDKSKLPPRAVTRIGAAKYAKIEELQAEIKAEKDYIAEIAGSGRVFGLSEISLQKTHVLDESDARKKLYSKYPL
jgi:hypothetical protein